MEKAKQRSISMTDTQKERLKSLSKDLDMPESRVVNHLIALANDNQVLKDLLIKLDRLPWETTNPDATGKLAYINNVYEILYKKMAEEINQYLTDHYYNRQFSNWCREHTERVIKIAKTRWIEED